MYLTTLPYPNGPLLHVSPFSWFLSGPLPVNSLSDSSPTDIYFDPSFQFPCPPLGTSVSSLQVLPPLLVVVVSYASLCHLRLRIFNRSLNLQSVRSYRRRTTDRPGVTLTYSSNDGDSPLILSSFTTSEPDILRESSLSHYFSTSTNRILPPSHFSSENTSFP